MTPPTGFAITKPLGGMQQEINLGSGIERSSARRSRGNPKNGRPQPSSAPETKSFQQLLQESFNSLKILPVLLQIVFASLLHRLRLSPTEPNHPVCTKSDLRWQIFFFGMCRSSTYAFLHLHLLITISSFIVHQSSMATSFCKFSVCADVRDDFSSAPRSQTTRSAATNLRRSSTATFLRKSKSRSNIALIIDRGLFFHGISAPQPSSTRFEAAQPFSTGLKSVQTSSEMRGPHVPRIATNGSTALETVAGINLELDLQIEHAPIINGGFS